MKAIFASNSNLDLKYALFTITEYHKNTYPPFSFELKCSNNNYLCANGWQNTCAPLKVQGFKESNRNILLFVDSKIINYLDAKKVYTFILNSHEQPPQSTTLTLDPLDFLSPHNAEIKAADMDNEPNITEFTASQNPNNATVVEELKDASGKPITCEHEAENTKAMQGNASTNAPNENEPILERKHYPLIIWFLTIWLSGCLIFGYLMFKEQIDNYFSNPKASTQNESNSATIKESQ